MKFRASTCNSNYVMSDKRNSKWLFVQKFKMVSAAIFDFIFV